jgi:hypothetical protein
MGGLVEAGSNSSKIAIGSRYVGFGRETLRSRLVT